MKKRHAPRACILAAGIAFGSTWLLAGCGSKTEDMGLAGKLSPEMQKQQDEMLKNYGKQAAEQGRAARAKRGR
jgi:hypothetical protein